MVRCTAVCRCCRALPSTALCRWEGGPVPNKSSNDTGAKIALYQTGKEASLHPLQVEIRNDTETEKKCRVVLSLRTLHTYVLSQDNKNTAKAHSTENTLCCILTRIHDELRPPSTVSCCWIGLSYCLIRQKHEAAAAAAEKVDPRRKTIQHEQRPA